MWCGREIEYVNSLHPAHNYCHTKHPATYRCDGKFREDRGWEEAKKAQPLNLQPYIEI